MTLEEVTDSLCEALDTLGLDSYAVVGGSIAGCVQAAYVALKTPSKVRAVCLVSPSWLKT